jgi:leucyl/phenylalanyl-tRNA--protein transferase
LKLGGFKLLDTQYVTDHLRRFGAVEISRRQYGRLLEAALTGEADLSVFTDVRRLSGAEAIALAQAPSC